MASPGFPTTIVPNVTPGHGPDSAIANAMLNAFDTDLVGVEGEVLVWTNGRWQPGNVAAGSISFADVVVASVDAPSFVKDNADFVCDGVADHVQVNQAIERAAALPTRDGPAGGQQRGTVKLTGGYWRFEEGARMRSGVTVDGSGKLTEVEAVGNNDPGLFMLNDPNVHLCTVSNMWMNGNYAAGGSCSGVYFDANGYTDIGTYPAAGSDHQLTTFGLRLRNFMTAANRHGIWIGNGARSGWISHCTCSSRTGNAFTLQSASDGMITHCIAGGGPGNGFVVAGGNSRIMQAKAFYSDGWGFDISSSRISAVGIEAQDCVNGIRITGQDFMGAGLVADTSRDVGLSLEASGAVLEAVNVFSRGARFDTQAIGIQFVGSPNNSLITGRVGSANITTRISGTYTGTGNFVRLTGSGLTSVG